MITSLERAERLLILCNKWKDRSKFYNADFYKYANYCWQLAYETGECELFYEDSGDNSYYDLVGLKINGEYACIPVPLLTSTQVAEIFKSQPVIIDKYDHCRDVINVDETDLYWEVLMSELVFLSLKPWNIGNMGVIYVMENQKESVELPQNPQVYDKRGVGSMPVYDEKYHQWYEYKGSVFKSWTTLSELFNAHND